MKKIRLSLVSWTHFVRLVLHSILFLLVLVFYILGRVTELKKLFESDKDRLVTYSKILYAQARLVSGMTLDNPSEVL